MVSVVQPANLLQCRRYNSLLDLDLGGRDLGPQLVHFEGAGLQHVRVHHPQGHQVPARHGLELPARRV